MKTFMEQSMLMFTTPSSTLSIKHGVNGEDVYTIYTNTGDTVSLTNNSIGNSHTIKSWNRYYYDF